MKFKKWFTLVELIIVITILSILWIIAFISFNSYTSNARDTKKIYSIKNIDSWLNLFFIKSWYYPLPDDITGTWVINTIPVNYSWKIWKNISQLINLSNSEDNIGEYLYWVSSDKKDYQIAWFINNSISLNLSHTAFAVDNNYAHIVWNYDWILVFNSWSSTKYVVNLPSLIFEWNGTIDVIQNEPLFLYNNISRWLSKTELLEKITWKNINVTSIALTGNENQINQLASEFWLDGNIIWKKIFWKNFQLSKNTKKLGIYYWWPSSLNHQENWYRLDNVVNDLNQYNAIILWAGLENPTHSDHNNTRDILNGTWWNLWYAPNWFSWYSGKTYWYTTLMQDYASLEKSILLWKNLWVDGIFFDEAWYDYLVDNFVFNNPIEARTHQNQAISYAHSLWLKVMMNAWVVDDVFWTLQWENPTLLKAWDAYLMESFVYNPHAVATQYYDYDNQLSKLNNAISYQNQFWIELHCVWLLPDFSDITNERIQIFYDKASWICDYIQITEEQFWATANAVLVNYLKNFE